jgi:CBS domain containing-hemolysin-like protein
MLVQWLAVALGLVLTFGTALFVAGEFSLVALDAATLELDTGLDSVRRALGRTSLHLSAAQVGITLTTIGLGYTTQPALAQLVSPLLPAGLGHAAAAGLAAAVALVLVNAVSMVGGELIPKNLAMARPLGTARRVSGFLLGFTSLFKPVIYLLHGASTAVLRAFRITPADEVESARSAQELAFLVRRSAAEGKLEPDLAERLSRTLALPDLRAVDAMTDRTQLVVLQRDATAADVIAQAMESGHSRLPVIDGSRDNVLGVVALRKAVAVPFERRSKVAVTALMSPIEQVPETAELGAVLVALREAGAQMAVVVDEYGGTSGVITIEDVVEELVGDVSDEHDPSRPAPRRLADGSWRLSGQLRPDEVASVAGLILPEDPAYETLGGLVMARLGRVPALHDQVVADGARLRVEQMAGRRVVAVRVWPPTPGEGEPK